MPVPGSRMRALLKQTDAIPTPRRFGRVARTEGLPVDMTGAAGAISLAREVKLSNGSGKKISSEVRLDRSATWTGNAAMPARICCQPRPFAAAPWPFLKRALATVDAAIRLNSQQRSSHKRKANVRACRMGMALVEIMSEGKGRIV